MTFRSHPSQSELLAYAEQQLAETEESRIKTHMADCTLCRTAVDQVLRSASQLKSLPLLPLSSAAEGRIRAALKNSQSYNQQTTPLVVKRWIAVAAAIVVGVASLLLYYQNRIQAIELHRPAAALSSFEETAARLHSERNGNRLTLDYTGDSPEQARKWIAQHVGVYADIATSRPAEDGRRFELQGAKLVMVGDVPVALVAYEIDHHPVTLLTAKASRLSGIPPRSYLSKRVFYRDNNGHHSLSWNSAGQVYTLVSDLPGFGQQSCYICHTDRKFRDRIDAMHLER